MHVPFVTYCTVNPFAVHTVGVVETTDVEPVSSLLVETLATNDLVTLPDAGRFEIVGVEGVKPATSKDWSEPVAAL